MAYATWDPAAKSAGVTLSGGNLTFSASAAGYSALRATIGVTSGKWYWEITLNSGSTSIEAIGVVNSSFPTDGTQYAGGTNNGTVEYRNGNIVKNDVIVGGGSGWGTNGDVICCALDFVAGTFAIKRNAGAWASTTSIPTGALYPFFGTAGGGATGNFTTNFGASAFAYTPPADHIGLQELLNFQHAMTGGVTVGGNSTIILQPLYIDMLGGITVGGEAGVVFENATRYEHAMTGGITVGADSAVSAPRNQLSETVPPHSVSANFADTAQLVATLPPHALDAEFATPAALSASVAVHTLDGTGKSGAVGVLDDQIAPHTILADDPWYADNALAVHTSDASLLGGGVSSLDEMLAPVSIEASAIPDFNGVASSAVPLHSADITYLAGSIGSADVIAASILLDASGFSGSVASLDQNVPAHTLESVVYPAHDAVASLVLLPHTLSASVVEAVSAAFKAWALNTHKLALTEYTAFQFNSFAVFKGKVYAAGSAGVMELAAQGTDNGTSIAATVRTGQHAFGTSFLKRVPRIYVGYKAAGDMEFRTITGEDGVRSYLLTYNGNPNLHQRRVPVGLGPKSPYWQFEFVNRSGADFTIDHILAHSAKVTHRRVM